MSLHVYVHNPFCVGKCPYCDFYSVTDSSLIEAYYESASTEVELWAGHMPRLKTMSDGNDSVYFGGGTPSYPPEEKVTGLLKKIVQTYGISPSSENTIEINPSSLTEAKAAVYLEGGFNRASLGVQSLDDKVLKTLGRRHDSEGAIKALKTLSNAGFTNISADLIIGVPGQSVEGIIHDIDTFVQLGVKHISTYSLTIEEGTPFYAKYNDCLEQLVDPGLEREMYHRSREYLESIGIIPYEISNSAYPGFESRHNASYWSGDEYAAIGAGSHGYLDSVRFGHYDDVAGYIAAIKGRTAGEVMPDNLYYEEERMSEEDKMREYPFLRLRTRAGVDRSEFMSRFGKVFDDVFGKELRSNIKSGYLSDDGRFIRLTSKGLDFANLVIEDFL